MTTKSNEKTEYTIGGNGSQLKVELPDFELTNSKEIARAEFRHFLTHESDGQQYLRTLPVTGIGTVKMADGNGKMLTHRRVELTTAKVGRKEELIPIFALEANSPKNWAWLDQSERISRMQIEQAATNLANQQTMAAGA